MVTLTFHCDKVGCTEKVVVDAQYPDMMFSICPEGWQEVRIQTPPTKVDGDLGPMLPMRHNPDFEAVMCPVHALRGINARRMEAAEEENTDMSLGADTLGDVVDAAFHRIPPAPVFRIPRRQRSVLKTHVL